MTCDIECLFYLIIYIFIIVFASFNCESIIDYLNIKEMIAVFFQLYVEQILPSVSQIFKYRVTLWLHVCASAMNKVILDC